uniref:Uncharacterized protein n=1 Tax=Octopus bimaculoides TaxID=37653 RepID=A0A0L8GVA1_OCTBM
MTEIQSYPVSPWPILYHPCNLVDAPYAWGLYDTCPRPWKYVTVKSVDPLHITPLNQFVSQFIVFLIEQNKTGIIICFQARGSLEFLGVCVRFFIVRWGRERFSECKERVGQRGFG